MLSHDAQGFLTGTVIPEIRRAAELLERIRNDVAAIKQAFQSSSTTDSEPNARPSASPPRPGGSDARPAEPDPATPPLRGGRGGALPPGQRDLQRAAEPSTGGGSPSQPGSASPLLSPNVEPAEPRPQRRRLSRSLVPSERDAQGRFTNNHQNPDEDESKQKRLFDGLGDRLAEAVTGSASSLEEVDPTVKAFQEVAQPLARGYQFLAGGNQPDKEERWYRRLWKEVKLFRKEQTVFNRAEQRVLNEISENTENQGAGSSGGGGGVLSMLAAMLGLGAGRSAAGGLGRVLGGIGGGLLRGVGGALRFGGKLLRRLPLIGGLFAGAGAAADVYGNETDDNLTRQEKDIRNGNAIGGAAGTVGGMMAGADAGSLFGPVGTIVGGLVGSFLGDQAGQIIGEKIGEWTNSLREYDLPGKVTDSFQVGWEDIKTRITEKWDEGVKFFTDLWEPISKFLEDKFGIVKDVANKANDYVKDKTGVDVKAGVTATAQKAAELAEKGIEEAKKLPEKAKETLNQGVEWLKDNTTIGKGVSALSGAVDKGLGYISSRYEGDVGTVHKDNKGFSYGKYQFNTEGGLSQFLKDNPKYAEQLLAAGVPGSDAFNKKWRQIAQEDYKGFKSAQEASGKKRYYDPAIAKAASLGFNVNDRGIQEAMFSGAVQHGGWNSKVLPAVAERYDLKSMSAQEQLRVLYAERRRYAERNLTGSDLKNVLGRYDSEERNVLSLAAASVHNEAFSNEIRSFQAPMEPAVVSLPSPPSIPPIQAAPTVNDAPPQQITPYPVESARKNLNVSIDRGDVGRDLSERRLAHIVTGGLSS
jgi:hypothetical protein